MAGGPHRRAGRAALKIARVTHDDVSDLLPLVRAYCDFYEVSPTDESLVEVTHALIAAPETEGVQLLARGDDGAAIGFATLYWSWDTLAAGRIGIMHDLFVTPAARGGGAADSLIGVCVEECAHHRAVRLAWQTARDNMRAHRVYERVGATRDEWLDYWLPVTPASS